MNILGLNYIFHDTSACILKDGKLIAALEDERFTCDKHSQRFPFHAIKNCFKIAGMHPSEIQHIAVSFNPHLFKAEKTEYARALGDRSAPFLKYEFDRIEERELVFREWYERTWQHGSRPEIHYVDHHLAHAGGSYFVSPFTEASLLSVDGWGEWSSTWLGCATGNQLTKFGESLFPNSLGCFYSAATEFCGFQANYDEGKTMGLAPFGNPKRFYKQVAELVTIDDQGAIKLDQSPFSFYNTSGRFCSPEFEEIFGPSRGKGEEILPHHMDVAAAFQQVLEDRLIEICEVLQKRSSSRNLVLAGGTALNSVANGRICRELNFEKIYVMPGAGDNGTSIGAAYYVYNAVLNQEMRFYHNHAYLGSSYGSAEIQSLLEECKLSYKRSIDVCRDTAELLRSGKIIGWFQGKMEFGPRSLGNRSILADPTAVGMKDKINAEVKHREAFRPFAPSVTVEDVSRYFDFHADSPFMLMVCDVLEEWREKLPAITHVDGTARLQTVSKSTNLRYYNLLREFEKISGVPVLLNTSFNIMGQPIIESPLDAVRCFFTTGLDALVIDDFIVEKMTALKHNGPTLRPAETVLHGNKVLYEAET